MKYRPILLIACVILISTLGCRKTLEKPYWDVDVVAPVVTASMTINDLVPDSLLSVNPDSSLTLVFDNSVYRFSVADLVDIPDTSLVESLTIPFGSNTYNANDTIYTFVDEAEFNIRSAEITDLKIHSGVLEFTLSSTISQPHQLIYTIDNSGYHGIGGAPFSIIVDMPAGSQGSPAVKTESHNLDQYYFDLRGLSGTYNQLVTTTTIRNGPNSNPVLIQAGDAASVSSTFRDMIPQYIRGYFGSEVASIDPGTTDLSFFDRIIAGAVDIDDVDVIFEIENSIGVDARATINSLTSVNSRTGNTVPLNHTIIGETIILDRALDNDGQITSTLYSDQFDPGNSNIDLFLENLPDQIGYDLGLTINPLGNVSNGNDFMYYESELDVRMNATMPLCVLANDLTLTDTVSFDLYDDSIPGRINSATLNIFAENGFPLSTGLQLYLLDDAGVKVDSFITSGVIPAGSVDASQVVVAPSISQLVVEVPADRVDQIYGGGTRLEIRAKFNTPTQSAPHYKLYDHYRLDLKVTTDFNYTIQPE